VANEEGDKQNWNIEIASNLPAKAGLKDTSTGFLRKC